MGQAILEIVEARRSPSSRLLLPGAAIRRPYGRDTSQNYTVRRANCGFKPREQQH